ncbi:MAG: DUF1566 domain-containing protein [Deltaproteobacteria bacterium]|nr:DUF1566 domain-containing protein [Deltaproteobacteria bacterium]
MMKTRLKHLFTFLILFVLLPASHLAAAPAPDTGQTKCYDNDVEITCPQPGEPFYGQDAQYAGPARSYTKLGAYDVELPDTATYADGWLATRDNVTGLIWEMKTDDNTIHDKDNKYTWCDTNPATNGGYAGTCGNGTDTEDFINVINGGNFGGHDDWRLPSVKELSSLLNASIPMPGPTIDTSYFPDTVSSDYWSSTTSVNYTYNAWRVHFTSGYVASLNKSNSYYARAVRAGQAGALGDLVINGDGTVTDTATGLMWQQCSLGQTWNPATQGCDGTATPVDWQDALEQSENLNMAGYSDWRLPNRNELQSLVDYSRYSPSIDTTSFPGTKPSYYWSSTTSANYTNYAWYVHFNYGHVGYDYKSFSYYARAVRAGQSGALGDLVISGLTPASGPVTGGTTVTVTGENFGSEQGAGFVTFDGVEATITSWNDTEIVCVTPSRPAGAVELAVTRNDGAFAIRAASFTFFLPGYGFNQRPDTGQTKCYDNSVEITCPQPGEPFYGQDAQYAGPARSYTKLGYGDVELPDTATYADGWLATRDNVTGLIWEMKSDDGSIHDKDNKYTWCDTNPATNGGDPGICGNGTDTEDFINAINDGNFGGHDDWRLPTVEELSALVNSSIPDPGPVVALAYFPGTVSSGYWSSTSGAYNTYNAWYVSFLKGNVYNGNKSYSYYVRAVRAGEAGSLGDLVTNGDGTVTDTATGLMWQQCSLGQTWNPATQGCDGTAISVNWQDALEQSENLTLAGYSDWRLPNRNELQSLVDYSRSYPSIDTTSFPGTKPSNYWSSTTYAGSTYYAWYVSFHYGYVNYDIKFSFYVRAVRAGQGGALGDLVISGLTPASGPVTGGTTVTVTGQNFGSEQGAGFVTFDGVEATITSWNNTEIVCVTPSRPAGAVELAVTRDDGGSVTMASAFTFFDPVDMDFDGDVDGLDAVLYIQALQEGTDLTLVDFAGSFGR